LTSAEALDIIDELYFQMMHEDANPEEILFNEGLEPDYIDDLIYHVPGTVYTQMLNDSKTPNNGNL
jgi:hypothetical protein